MRHAYKVVLWVFGETGAIILACNYWQLRFCDLTSLHSSFTQLLVVGASLVLCTLTSHSCLTQQLALQSIKLYLNSTQNPVMEVLENKQVFDQVSKPP